VPEKCHQLARVRARRREITVRSFMLAPRLPHGLRPFDGLEFRLNRALTILFAIA
jgi:hypothetical protein